MLEIKTIWKELVNSNLFDDAVNEAIAEGWELVRREVLPRRTEFGETLLYAEFERIIEEQEEEYAPVDFAKWEITRDPHHPYRCSNCGFKAINNIAVCPSCSASMSEVE